ncbi:bifunctional [glutamate--ammonia ligase]-adenylyl-L-tyrosine phosphorylase/[glutamate--ammonia-ligase] adenylyltransferase [Thiomicrorhabdus xiamenensis]|uniref:Bifunctional glutamine synthetase adenylyltransferase/adenylyl-removing enzyme n=1 Tax=Thiomicrorhabdus xiamenensis TaxID=2739063 RepID=A0A7D4TGM2_9GAMM|nr:bifunctional [glutamate--ammonia ligase]-adenylyl-L-tyrosine phosphorylase/[glutamate--ammonia-ligase] adenylyltransferase [Thiomicrorhabdus xiamenensis]QKI89708.1 bifunctional [glutamate--ammonia ligase]-adenylyl-L-tyrosine phosphorylase/[glutamate--ammonia-ligase] adenylyltransferase [Thiomicrorhabdus xiamenensis]
MKYDLAQVQKWSPFVERNLRRYPELLEVRPWEKALEQGALYRQVYEHVVSSGDEATLKQRLRLERNQIMARIAIRDLGGLADLEESMREVSDLADALVNAALDWHYAKLSERYGVPIGDESGEPQKMLVIGMGKLGGQELNFSSDIDLIFAYPERGQTNGARKVSNEEFFVRLGQAMNKSLVEVTGDGFVYRVDMRLRPFGDAGTLAVSFSALEHYYEVHGRAWERYALVKARVMAGESEQAAELFEVLRPFVYRRYVDFTAMDSLRDLKRMIRDQVNKKGMLDNIKLGPGGIREVEFIVQAFQLVHGGRDRALQGRQLLPMLALLEERGFLDAEVAEKLRQAYRFLRRAENRLQMWNDLQTHDLPQNPEQQQSLAESMGFASYERFIDVLSDHRQFVQDQFSQVFAEQDVIGERDSMDQLWQGDLDDSDLLTEFELSDERRAEVLALLKGLKSSRTLQMLSKDGRDRLDVVMPLLLHEALKPEYDEVALGRALAVIEAIARRSVYLVLLKENPQALKNLLQLCHVSAWLSDMLVKYPALLDQLIDERSLYAPLDAESLLKEAWMLMEQCDLDEERFMQDLRQWRHAQVFKVAAADVTGNVHIMKVSDYLTWIAEAVLKVTVEFAWRLMKHKSGLPGGLNESDPNPMLVLGYGKLGGIELGYGSDLDVVMLYHGVEPGAQSVSPTGRSLDNSLYFVRMGQKVVSLITTLMPAGVLYELDTRLRPNGASGMMVVSFDEFCNYIENKAWTWEHQALVRVRAVAGSDEAVQSFNGFKQAFIARERRLSKLREEVVEMRQKMQDSLDKSNQGVFDLKQGRGGIVDIEFMMQYLVLGHAYQYPDLTEFSDNMRILEKVAEHQLLETGQVEALMEAYQVYRSKYHRLSLQNEKAMVPNSCYPQQRENVAAIWQKLMVD